MPKNSLPVTKKADVDKKKRSKKPAANPKPRKKAGKKPSPTQSTRHSAKQLLEMWYSLFLSLGADEHDEWVGHIFSLTQGGIEFAFEVSEELDLTTLEATRFNYIKEVSWGRLIDIRWDDSPVLLVREGRAHYRLIVIPVEEGDNDEIWWSKLGFIVSGVFTRNTLALMVEDDF